MAPFSRSSKRAPKLVAGWNERVDLPLWGIRRLPAKVDTGARSSALHVTNLEPHGHFATFDVVVGSGVRHRRVRARISRTGHVKSSSGHQDRRYFVRTRIRIGSIERDVELNLVDREGMRFRMLLGRTALSGLLVDPTRARVLSRRTASS